MTCQCEFCRQCAYCGHKADEHLAGDGHCFECECIGFCESLASAWNNLQILHPHKFGSLQEFINKWTR